MKYRLKEIFTGIFALVLMTSNTRACRLFSMIANESFSLSEINGTQIYLDEFQSLANTSIDGWGLLYYQNENFSEEDSIGGLFRDNHRANEGSSADAYDNVQALIANSMNVTTLMGHIRNATSGCGSGENETKPNDPHPWIWHTDDGVTYSFTHNGTIIQKEALLNLIGSDFISNNGGLQTFEYCGCGGNWYEDDGFENVIDSEIYFFWLMKNILYNNGNVLQGIQQALMDTTFKNITETSYLNFILTNGSSLWGYKKGNNLLYWLSNDSNKVFMTEPSDSTWMEMSDDQLVYLPRNSDGIVYNGFSEPSSALIQPQKTPEGFKLYGNYPNPFNGNTQISFFLPHKSDLTLSVFDITGKEVATQCYDNLSIGEQRIKWNASALPSGMYLYQINNQDQILLGKVLVIK